MDRTLFGIATTFALALLLVGLTFSRSVDAPADFRFINRTEPQTIDPHLMTGEPEGRLSDALFEGVTRRDAKTLRPAPGVAASWDVSPDGLKYTFHLRRDARWSDGRPVTAHDFVYSWKRLITPETGAEYAYILFMLRHAEAFSTYDGHADTLLQRVVPALEKLPAGADSAAVHRALTTNRAHAAFRAESDPRLVELLSRRTGPMAASDLAWLVEQGRRAAGGLRRAAAEARARFGVDAGVFARDDHTLVAELRAPTPYFLDVTSFHSAMPVPRWLTEDPARARDWFRAEHLVGNGPYRIARWIVNDRIRLERSETYWGKDEVRLRSIDVLPVENATTSMNLYLTGDVDWVPDNYPRELASVLKTRPDFHKSPGLIVYYYRLNTTRPPLDDRRVRKALNLAVDRRLVTEVLGLGQLTASTFVPPGIDGYDSPETDLALDVPRARALLAEAGFPGGKGFPEIGILYNTDESHKRVAEMVGDQLRRHLGITVNTYNQEWQSYLETNRAMDYWMSRAGWIGDYADPNTFLDLWITNGGNNQTGWSSPTYDRLLHAAADVRSFAASPEALLERMKRPDDVRAALVDLPSSDAAAALRAQARVRMLLLREAESLLVNDELPIIPVYFYVKADLVKPWVKGIYTVLEHPDGRRTPNLQALHPLRDVWIDPEARP